MKGTVTGMRWTAAAAMLAVALTAACSSGTPAKPKTAAAPKTAARKALWELQSERPG